MRSRVVGFFGKCLEDGSKRIFNFRDNEKGSCTRSTKPGPESVAYSYRSSPVADRVESETAVMYRSPALSTVARKQNEPGAQRRLIDRVVDDFHYLPGTDRLRPPQKYARISSLRSYVVIC